MYRLPLYCMICLSRVNFNVSEQDENQAYTLAQRTITGYTLCVFSSRLVTGFASSFARSHVVTTVRLPQKTDKRFAREKHVLRLTRRKANENQPYTPQYCHRLYVVLCFVVIVAVQLSVGRCVHRCGAREPLARRKKYRCTLTNKLYNRNSRTRSKSATENAAVSCPTL